MIEGKFVPGSNEWVEAHIGEAAALVAVSMIMGVNERIQEGAVSPDTRRFGGDILACLVRWKLDERLDWLDFNATVKRLAPETLHRICPTLDTDTIQKILVDVLEVVDRTIRKHVN